MGLRKVLAAPELIATLLTQGNELHTRITVGLPAGARLVSVVPAPGGNQMIEGAAWVEFVFEHESWSYSEDGSVPVLNLSVVSLPCARVH